ncbi:TonB-dependent receptor [Chitinimonas viridis]|uniref:TonB-dependent receptor n=1 Tax=Chitinimonas viridis TaxID=664880 RepID=A0ABT8B502_9NEIS|nr:TonB-dependent receptor [Chitinimonas viridis]MDN3577084.1 TonB-dependent receptor [Chitinimonas viridis]
MKLKQLAYAISLIGLATASAAYAADEVKTERIQVTGSNIKRVAAEGATQVVTLNREQIERSGATSAGEVLRLLPAINGDDNSTYSLRPTDSGYQAANARGSFSATSDILVLVDGRRMPVYPEQGQVVDLNSVPMSAIERVEYLNSGASSIYGSDAVMGVINIITRKSLEGVQLRARLGETSRNDGARLLTSIAAGYGNLETQGWNLMVSGEYEKVDNIFMRDRNNTRTADLRHLGGPDRRLASSPDGNLQRANGTWQPLSTCTGNTPAGGVPLPSVGRGLFCPFDPNSTTQIQPEVESVGLMANLMVKFGENLNLRTNMLYKHKESGNFLNPNPLTLAFNANQNGNPYNERVTVAIRPLGPGLMRNKDIEVDLTRLSATLSGSIKDFEWEVNAASGKSEYAESGSGYYNAAKLAAAQANGTLNPFNGTFTAANVMALGILEAPKRTSETQLDSIDFIARGDLFELPAGPVGFAGGLGYFEETYKDTPDPLQVAGALFQDPQLATVNKSRDNVYYFGEVNVPVIKGLDLGLAIRQDKYTEFKSPVTSTVSLRYQPVTQFLLRASYGEGFKAPTLRQLYATQTSGFPSAKDFTGCAINGQTPAQCVTRQYQARSTSNASLKPEQSESKTAGFVFAPIKNLTFSVDYTQIDKTDQIETLVLQDVLSNPTIPVAGYGTAANLVTRLPNGLIDETVAIILPRANLAKTSTKLLDFNIQGRTQFGATRISVDNALNYIISAKKSPLPGVALAEYVGLSGFQRWRNVASVKAENGPWSGSVSVRSIAGFVDTLSPSAAASTPHSPSSFTTADLLFGYGGFMKNSKVELGVRNVFDRAPTWAAASNSSSNVDLAHDVTGRYYYLSLQLGF